MSTEHDLRRACSEHLASLGPGVWWMKVHGHRHQRANVPDYLILHGAVARLVAVELKRPGEAPRVGQVREMQRMTAAGAIVRVVETVGEFKRLLFRVGRNPGKEYLQGRQQVAQLLAELDPAADAITLNREGE